MIILINILVVLIGFCLLNNKINNVNKKLEESKNGKTVIPTEIASSSLFRRIYGRL